jgi:hypothetical protein
VKASPLSEELRARLRAFADALIPAAHGMPSANEVGVADAQLEHVLAARPDLLEPLRRALSRVDPDDAERSLTAIQAADPAAHDALVLVIAGGYYIDPRVRDLIGYDGQVPAPLQPEDVPSYVEEGLIDAIVTRGPIYRRPD